MIGLVALLAAVALAQPAGPPPLALVVSGGVSLGSYQAGYLYYLNEAVRRPPAAVDPVLLTGTSAGSINALLMAMASCQPPVPDPRDSLFYRTWIPIGFDQLYQPGDTTARSAFSRSAFGPAARVLRAEFERGLRRDCERTLGFTTTRVVPGRARVGVLSELPYSEERFAVILRGRGLGELPLVESTILPGNPLPQPVLPLEGASDPLSLLLDVVYASAAFPLAFEPVTVPFCSTEGLVDEAPRCSLADAEPVELVDGALFDNTPLRLAVELSRARELRPGPFALLPTDMAWPRPSGAMAGDEVGGTFKLVQQIGQGFVETAQQSELRTVVDQYPEVLERLVILQALLPNHGEALYAFGGFFERGFREADFVQGMAAAHFAIRDAESRWGTSSAIRAAPEAGVAMPREVTAARPGWRAFDCLVALLEGGGGRARECRHPEVTPLRPLFQVALDRLYAECVVLREQGVPLDEIRDSRCRHAHSGGRPPLVPGLEPPTDAEWRRLDDEDWLGHQLRRLYAHGFVWTDEGLGVARPGVARRHLRDRLAQPALALARSNTNTSNRLVRLLAELGLNQLTYAVPQQLAYVGAGPQVEAGWSARLGRGPGEWFRVGGVLAIEGLTSPLSSRENFVGVTPLLELQIEPVPLSSPLLQPRLGVQLGYRFSSLDRLGAGTCGGEGRICTQPAVRFQFGVSLLQRLRAQFGVGLFPAAGDAPLSIQLLPQIAVQFPTKL